MIRTQLYHLMNEEAWSQKSQVIFPRTQSKKAALPIGEYVGLACGVRKSVWILSLLLISSATGHLLSLRLNFCMSKVEMERILYLIGQWEYMQSTGTWFIQVLNKDVFLRDFSRPEPKCPDSQPKCFTIFPFHQPWDYNHVFINHSGYLMRVWGERKQRTRNTCELTFLTGWYWIKTLFASYQLLILPKTLRLIR